MSWNEPQHKFSAAAIAGGLVTITSFLIEHFLKLPIPGPVQVGLTIVLTPGVSLLIPDKWEMF